MPLPTKDLTLHLKRESATINLLGLLAHLYIHYENDDHVEQSGRITLVMGNHVAKFVRRMSKMNL